MSTQMEDEKKAALRKKIEHQVACEEKAFRIVERLIENPVELDWFVDSLQFITPNHYQDVIEERTVSKLCGYPLCQNLVGKVPKQKYFISTKSNKVYNIEERKNFCNSRCYKASLYIQKQISSVPVWSRKNEPRKKFELLPLDMKVGKLGDEVQISAMDDTRAELKKLERLDYYQKSWEDMDLSNRRDLESGSKRNPGAKPGAEQEVPGSDECVYSLGKALAEMGISEDDLEHEKRTKTSDDGYKVVKTEKEKEKSAKSSEESKASAVDRKECDGKGKTQSVKHISTPDNVSQQTKTEYLMKLLDRKKSLLAKMADIQSVTGETNSNESHSEQERSGGRKLKELEKSVKSDGLDTKSNDVTEDSACERKQDKVSQEADKTKVKVSAVEEAGSRLAKETSKQGDGDKTVNVTVLHVICLSLKSWITKETVKYLKSREEGEGEAAAEKSKFEKQYRALVAKVDAQEREFSALLGEEGIEEDADDRPTAPPPHFEVLRQEMAQNQLRVREFMRGSFTYRTDTQEAPKEEMNQKEIVLPTVDRYDQLLIRQRIVMDRIHKALPSLLSPLLLPVGDVSTGLRELTETFNLTSNNISFRPVEWTIVALVLLKMLSRRHLSLSEAFSIPSAEKFLQTLLSGIKTDSRTLEQQVDMLTQSSR